MGNDSERDVFIPARLLEVLAGHQELLGREVAPGEEQSWLNEMSTLSAEAREGAIRLYIAALGNLDDKAATSAYQLFIQELEPVLKRLFSALQEKACRLEFDEASLAQKIKKRWLSLRVRREDGEIEAEIAALHHKYESILSSAQVHFRGREYSLGDADKLLKDEVRASRREAWFRIGSCWRELRDELEGLFEKLLSLRNELADRNGFKSYVEFHWANEERHWYTPEDVVRLRNELARLCLPVLTDIEADRAGRLGLSAVEPWDRALLNPSYLPPPWHENESRLLDIW